MGRKSKRKTNPGPDESAKADRKELIKLCGQLLDLAATHSPATPTEQWDEFVRINNVVEKIRKRQHDSPVQLTGRDTYFDDFVKWLHDNGISTDSVQITKFEEGYGLQATKNIEMNEEILSIPRKVMMTDQNARESAIGELIRGDRLLKGMPNVSLAVFLFSEKVKLQSFWQPYIDILPAAYSIPLYFSPSELQMLQGSPVFSEALKQRKNIARQYAYLYKLFNIPENTKLHLRDSFTYDVYRWAVATVMTRQNQIPSQDALWPTTALIPLWDMCNHTNGEMKTDFSRERDACINMALRDFGVGDQIYICYGRRANAYLLLYSGFVYPPNTHDSVAIQLGLSSRDRLYAMKAQLCAIMRLGAPAQTYQLACGDEPVSSELLTFLRIFCMSEDELKERLLGERRAELLSQLPDRDEFISKLNERRVYVYLATRVTLLQKQYNSTVEEDEEKLKDDKLSYHERLSVELLLCEKRILENTFMYCSSCRQRADTLQPGATSYKFQREQQNDEDVAEKWEDRAEEENVDDGKGSVRPETKEEGGTQNVEQSKANVDSALPEENGDVLPKTNADVAVSKINGDVKVNGDHLQSNGDDLESNEIGIEKGVSSGVHGGRVNGDITEERTAESVQNSDSVTGKTTEGAMCHKSKQVNGHLPLASETGLTEE